MSCPDTQVKFLVTQKSYSFLKLDCAGHQEQVQSKGQALLPLASPKKGRGCPPGCTGQPYSEQEIKVLCTLKIKKHGKKPQFIFFLLLFLVLTSCLKLCIVWPCKPLCQHNWGLRGQTKCRGKQKIFKTMCKQTGWPWNNDHSLPGSHQQ